MSYLVAAPDLFAAATANLNSLGTSISEANGAWAGPISSLLPAAQDEVSAAIAALFGTHAQSYQALSQEAQAFHQQFVQALSSAGNAYSLAESVNANPLQAVSDLINAPSQALFQRPLFGNGADGAAGTSANGGAGGLLWGNGGAGGSGADGQVGGNGVPPGCSVTVAGAVPAAPVPPAVTAVPAASCSATAASVVPAVLAPLRV